MTAWALAAFVIRIRALVWWTIVMLFRRHRWLNGPVPVAATVNVAEPPSNTVWLSGWTVMVVGMTMPSVAFELGEPLTTEVSRISRMAQTRGRVFIWVIRG